MQRLCRRRTVCRVARSVVPPTGSQACPSVRARWMAVPVTTTSSRLHRCLSTTSTAASSTSSPAPRSSTSSSSNTFFLIALAGVAGSAALYATTTSSSTETKSTTVDKKKDARKTEELAPAKKTSPLAKHNSNTGATSPLSTPTAPPASTPTPAADSTPSAALPTASESQLTPVNVSADSSDTTTTSAAASLNTTATDKESATATRPSHEHSPSTAATPPSQPMSAAEIAYLARYYTAPADEHPTVRNLRILTANRIDEVLATSPPFLLYLFDPTCAACALYTPIVHALAYALDASSDTDDINESEEEEEKAVQSAEGVRLYAMNDATDYKPGFLLPSEENVLPILKFFPQASTAPSTDTSLTAASSSSPTSIQYTGSPHLSAILRFLHSQTNGAFNLDRALQRARTRLPSLRAELSERGAKRLQQSEDWALYLHSPCSALIREYSMAELMSKYVEGEESAEGKYDRFVQCMEEKEEETVEYFEMMAMIANDTVEQLREKRDKKARQRGGEGDNADKNKESDNAAH